MSDLPDADDVFLRYFAPWYTPEDLARRGYEATRPDVEHRFRAGVRAAEVSQLAPDGQAEVAERVTAMLDAARGDWPDLLGVADALGLDGIDAFDQFYDRQRVAEVLAASDPSDFSNELLVLCCEFAAVLGNALQKQAPRLEWLYDWPYWESSLLDPEHGYRINVFHWAVKKFSDYGVDDGYRAKVLQCSALVEHGWS